MTHSWVIFCLLSVLQTGIKARLVMSDVVLSVPKWGFSLEFSPSTAHGESLSDVSLLLFVWGPDWSLSWQRETLTCVAVDSQKKERKTLAGDGGGDFITLHRLIAAKDTLAVKFPHVLKMLSCQFPTFPNFAARFESHIMQIHSLNNNNNCLFFLETHMEIAPLIMSQRALIRRRPMSNQAAGGWTSSLDLWMNQVALT